MFQKGQPTQEAPEKRKKIWPNYFPSNNPHQLCSVVVFNLFNFEVSFQLHQRVSCNLRKIIRGSFVVLYIFNRGLYYTIFFFFMLGDQRMFFQFLK